LAVFTEPGPRMPGVKRTLPVAGHPFILHRHTPDPQGSRKSHWQWATNPGQVTSHKLRGREMAGQQYQMDSLFSNEIWLRKMLTTPSTVLKR